MAFTKAEANCYPRKHTGMLDYILSLQTRRSPAQGSYWDPMRRPVDRRAFRDELQRARGFSLPLRSFHLSMRTWSLLYVKAVSAVLDDPLLGDTEVIKRIAHSYLGYAPPGIKLATGSDDGRLRIVDAATGAVEQEVPHEGGVFSIAWSP